MKALSKLFLILGCALFSNQTYSQCIDKFPYSQNFEKFTNFSNVTSCDNLTLGDTADGWTQDQTDDGEWRADTAGTPSVGTGPGSDGTSSGVGVGTDFKPGTTSGVFLYTEASGTPCHNSEINLLSPCIDFSKGSKLQMKFAYHMLGESIESLHIDVLDSNVWVNDVWVRKMYQSKNWEIGVVSLFDFKKSSSKIRIRAKMANQFSGDIAIDAFELYEVKTKYDLAIEQANDTSRKYSLTTINHPDSVPYDIRIANYGTENLSGIELNVTCGKWSHKQNIGSLAAQMDTVFTMSKKLFPNASNMQNVSFTVSMNETDGNSSNNTLTQKTGLNDSILAKDQGTLTGGFGFNATGRMGQSMTVQKADTLTSFSFFITNTAVGDSMRVHLYEFNGTPGKLVLSSKTIYTNGMGWYTAELNCSQALSPGDYFVAVEQMVSGSNMGLGYTKKNFHANTVYSDGGAGFATIANWDISFLVRMGFGKVQRPTAKITSLNEVCAGQRLILNGSGGTSYLWGPSAIIKTPKNKNTSAISDTSYSVTLNTFDACGVKSYTSNKHISVKPNPKGQVTLQSTICFGESVTLEAKGGSSFKWVNGPSNSNWTVSPTSSNTYTAVFDSTNGCKTTLNSFVAVTKVVANAGSDTTICEGNTAILEGSGANSYSWSPGGSGAKISVQPKTTTEYILTATSLNNCEGKDTVVVNVNPLPNLVMPNDTIVCFGRRFDFEAKGGDSIQWRNGPSTAIYSVLPITTTYYFAEAFSKQGCSTTDSVHMEVAPVPQVKLREDTMICEGTSLQLEALTNNDVKFKWNTGDTTKTISVSPTVLSEYRVLVNNKGNCSDSAKVTIDIDPLPTIKIQHTISEGKLSIQNASTNGNKHKWVFDDGDESTDKSPFHKYQDTGTYFVKYTIENDCGTRDTTIEVVHDWVNILAVSYGLGFKIYPQPAHQSIYIQLDNIKGNKIDVELYDMSSKKVLDIKNQLLKGNRSKVGLDHLKPGTYMIRISDGNRLGRKLIVIQ